MVGVGAEIIAGIVAQSGGEPIPNGWVALGGALGLTASTIWAFRKINRWTVTDLETTLARKDAELAAVRADVEEERATAERLRAEYDAVVEEKRALRMANITLAADLAAAQVELRLRRSTNGGSEGRSIRGDE